MNTHRVHSHSLLSFFIIKFTHNSKQNSNTVGLFIIQCDKSTGFSSLSIFILIEISCQIIIICLLFLAESSADKKNKNEEGIF